MLDDHLRGPIPALPRPTCNRERLERATSNASVNTSRYDKALCGAHLVTVRSYGRRIGYHVEGVASELATIEAVLTVVGP